LLKSEKNALFPIKVIKEKLAKSTKKKTKRDIRWVECKIEEIVEALETIIRSLQMK